MNDQLGRQLQKQIEPADQVRVVAIAGDAEALNFAHQVFQWLRANGYDNVTGVDQGFYTQPVVGQWVGKIGDKYEIKIGSRQ